MDRLRGEDIEHLLRRFRHEMQADGVLGEFRRRQAAATPAQERRMKSARAARRKRLLERKLAAR